jgi:hypothetical protein
MPQRARVRSQRIAEINTAKRSLLMKRKFSKVHNLNKLLLLHEELITQPKQNLFCSFTS